MWNIDKIQSTIKRNHFFKMLFLSIFWLFTDYIMNHIVGHIPVWTIRKMYLRLCFAKIKKRTRIDMGCSIQDANSLVIGTCPHINRKCTIDARGSITIGNCVSISQQVALMTGSHDIYSPGFDFVRKQIMIDDYVWIGFRAIVLGGVHIGKGAVVCAGTVLTKDAEPYGIYAGIPAKKKLVRALKSRITSH